MRASKTSGSMDKKLETPKVNVMARIKWSGSSYAEYLSRNPLIIEY